LKKPETYTMHFNGRVGPACLRSRNGGEEAPEKKKFTSPAEWVELAGARGTWGGVMSAVDRQANQRKCSQGVLLTNELTGGGFAGGTARAVRLESFNRRTYNSDRPFLRQGGKHSNTKEKK